RRIGRRRSRHAQEAVLPAALEINTRPQRRLDNDRVGVPGNRLPAEAEPRLLEAVFQHLELRTGALRSPEVAHGGTGESGYGVARRASAWSSAASRFCGVSADRQNKQPSARGMRNRCGRYASSNTPGTLRSVHKRLVKPGAYAAGLSSNSSVTSACSDAIAAIDALLAGIVTSGA